MYASRSKRVDRRDRVGWVVGVRDWIVVNVRRYFLWRVCCMGYCSNVFVFDYTICLTLPCISLTPPT